MRDAAVPVVPVRVGPWRFRSTDTTQVGIIVGDAAGLSCLICDWEPLMGSSDGA